LAELTIAYAHRETWELMQGIEIGGLSPRAVTDGSTPSNQVYTLLANPHEWDVGEIAFSTYLMCADLGCEDIALPIFPARMTPHAGVFVHESAGITSPADLVGSRIGCNSFGTNYSVWGRGMLAHQYDVTIERITWVQSVAEHRADYRLPSRFQIEMVEGNVRSEALLADGRIDAATTAGAGIGPRSSSVRPLFADPYAELRAFVEEFGFVPLNTVIIVRRSAVQANPDLPELLLEAFRYAQQRQAASPPEHEAIYRRLGADTGRPLLESGFAATREGIRTGIAFAYEQGIIRKLYDPEELFLLPQS
jgi:4,5-dihydroxyphthalate decarboxylase